VGAGVGATRRGAGSLGSALPFVRAEMGAAARSSCSTDTAFTAMRRIKMPTPVGMVRSPDRQRLIVRTLTPNSRATRELREVECVERPGEFGRGRGARASLPELLSKAGRCFLPSRVA